MSRAAIVDTDTQYRELAALWHGGMWSPLYAYCSSGSVVRGLCNEIRACIRQMDYTETDYDPYLEVDALTDFLGHVAPIEDQLPEETHAPDCKCSSCYVPRV